VTPDAVTQKMTEITEQLRPLKYYTLTSFFVIGVITVLLGQVLPILSTRLNLNDAQAGTLFLAQFMGSMTGTLLAARITKRYGFVMTILFGLLLIILGLPGLNTSEFVLCWLTIFIYGSGLGVTIPSINLLTIEMTDPSMQASAVNLINFSWGIGAICSQPFVSLVSGGNSLVVVTVVLILAVFGLTICFLFELRKLRRNPTDEPIRHQSTRIWRQPTSWLFVLFGFFVIGIESGLGGWLTTYSETLRAGGNNTINATVVFFSFYILGRGIASVIARRISENVLISICSATLVTGVSLIVLDENLATAGAAVAGLGSSAIFPTNMVRFARIFGPTATRQATPLFVAGIIGAASVSSLVGFVSFSFGSLRMGLAVILVSAVIVLALQVVIAFTFRPVVTERTEV
jgi:fucose permease